MITIKGKVQGMVIGNGHTITNTFDGGALTHQTVNGRDAAERRRRYDLVARHGVPDDLATWHMDLPPSLEAKARRGLAADYGVVFE